MPPIWLTGRELAERIDERYETVMDWARHWTHPQHPYRASGHVLS